MKQEYQVKVDDSMKSLLINRGLNRSALAQRPFTLRPTSFTSTIDGLKPKQFSSKKQMEMLESFLKDPTQPVNYCVVSAPNDGMAKLFAAWLMQHAIRKSKSRNELPLWSDILAGFDNKLVTNRVGASLLILNNVGTNSTQPKLEKLRDTIETYTDIPKIIIATGCDPYMFFTRHLFLPVHAVAYLTTNAVQRTVEI